jgi:hypothetical protein
MSEENVEVVRRAFEAAFRQPPDFGTVNERGEGIESIYPDGSAFTDSTGGSLV